MAGLEKWLAPLVEPGTDEGAPGAREPATRAFEVALWLLLAASVIVRCAYLELQEYKGDEAYFVAMAQKNAAELGSLTSLHSSQGIPNPAGFAYLLAPVVMLTSDPVQLAAFIAVANLIGLALYFLFLERFFSRRTALWGVTLMASLPWAVILSRKIWNPDIIFPFAVAFYGIFFSLLHRPARWKVYAAFAALALLTHMQLSTWLLLPPIALYACIARPKVRWIDVLSGAALFAATHIPYALDVLNIEPDPALPSEESEYLASIAHSVGWATQLNSALGFRYLLGRIGFRAFRATLGWRWIAWLPYVYTGFAILAVGLIGYPALRAVWRGRRGGAVAIQDHIAAFFLVLLVCVLGELIVMGHQTQPHQVCVLYPALPLFATLLVVRLARHPALPRRAAHAAPAFLVAVIGFHVYFMARFHAFVGEQPDNIYGDYGVPYAVRLKELGPAGFEAWEQRQTTKILQQSTSPSEARRQLADNAPVQAVFALAQRQPRWSGTLEELYREITPAPRPADWPRNPYRLWEELRKVAPLMSRAGVSIRRTQDVVHVKNRLAPPISQLLIELDHSLMLKPSVLSPARRAADEASTRRRGLRT